jgi:hypothetical protein
LSIAEISNSSEVRLTEKGVEGFFLRAEVCWSNGALENIKFQAPNRGPAQGVGTPKEKYQGVRCQGRKTKKLKPEH